MDCREIKKLLEDYIDNALSGEKSAAVKKHLASCRDCGAELLSRKDYRKQMTSLKEVKAPDDFMRQLNNRIDNQYGIKKIIRTLFYPLKIKLPVEALGVVAASVLIVVFLNPMEELKENFQIPAETAYKEKTAERNGDVKIAVPAKPGKKAGKAELSSPLGTDDRTLAEAGKERRSIRGEALMTREIVLALYQAKPAAASGALRSSASPATAPQSEESVAFNASDVKKDKAAGAISEPDRYATAEPEKKAQSAKMDALQKAKGQSTRDESINRRVTVIKPFEDIKTIVKNLNGRMVKEVSGKESTRYIIVDMPSKNQKEFLDRLNRLGDMQRKERKPYDERKSGIVRFKIIII